MSETAEVVEATVDVATAVKTFSKAVSKDLAYEAGVHITAVTVLLGTSYLVKKVRDYRRSKKTNVVTPMPVVKS